MEGSSRNVAVQRSIGAAVLQGPDQEWKCWTATCQDSDKLEVKSLLSLTHSLQLEENVSLLGMRKVQAASALLVLCISSFLLVRSLTTIGRTMMSEKDKWPSILHNLLSVAGPRGGTDGQRDPHVSEGRRQWN